jgi:hypothetical protein
MAEWEDARDRSKIKRINWKKVLNGKSLNRFVYDALAIDVPQEVIVHRILQLAKLHPEVWKDTYSWTKLVENVKIGVSARIAENNMLK